ncbi:hypothetical protein AB1Y20_010521 [Prymnesium parvum]|uniref:Right handed beta helix domain-containing protein n=1 Tax=Prymnesium parvum TaxID=97485 RepID=A0AB34INX7_PRYPA
MSTTGALPSPALSAWGMALLAGALGVLWLLIALLRARLEPQEKGLADGVLRTQPSTPHSAEEDDAHEFSVGARVRFHSLLKTPELNERHGVVLRYDRSCGRFVVRREVALAGESLNVTVKAANMRGAPPPASLAEVQAIVETAPRGARVTLPRGEVAAGASAAEAGGGAVLELKSAITLAGMGSRSGGTVLNFGVAVGEDVVGELVELAGLHVVGAVEVSPRDVARVKLTKIAITAPLDAPALILDEISTIVPPDSEASGRVLLDECWVRGGRKGVEINVVGCVLRHCRIQGAANYGIHANANFSIEGCTIGDCGKSGRGGGILTRAECTQLRQINGRNENRIQRDATDTAYSGYIPNCRGCVGQCTCTAMLALANLPVIRWAGQGLGKWQHLLEM